MTTNRTITVLQMPTFKKAYKKLHANIRISVDKAIQVIIKDPIIEQEKKGDLLGVFVYKFKVHQGEVLLAYEWDAQHRILLALGVHENFYHNLKKNRKA